MLAAVADLAGKNEPVRTFAIFTVRSPAAVVTTLSRVPLRWVVRASVRWCTPAPMCAVAFASTTAWSIPPRSRRMSSPLSAVRSISIIRAGQDRLGPSR